VNVEGERYPDLASFELPIEAWVGETLERSGSDRGWPSRTRGLVAFKIRQHLEARYNLPPLSVRNLVIARRIWCVWESN